MTDRHWRWVSIQLALAAHDDQLRLHGGLAAVRDHSLLESAMARPQHLAAYGDPDAAELAAAYAFGIARNHPFLDGNKRTALVVSITFLRDNSVSFFAQQAEASAAFEALASGKLSEAELADWFRQHVR